MYSSELSMVHTMALGMGAICIRVLELKAMKQ